MGEAREVMDRMTSAITEQDFDTVTACYAEDAVIVTPDQGEIRGREGIADYFKQQADAFPDMNYEYLHKHESGDVAIDEGFFTGTNTAPLPMPSGESLSATGKPVRVRACDAATVRSGLITNHRLYFDQVEFLEQLGLYPAGPS